MRLFHPHKLLELDNYEVESLNEEGRTMERIQRCLVTFGRMFDQHLILFADEILVKCTWLLPPILTKEGN
jgi:hypothetical protein